MKLKFTKISAILLLIVITTISCKDNTKPGLQYFPDMYVPIGYEPYSDIQVGEHSMGSMLPVEGTIARGQVLYDYPNTIQGYDDAKANSKNPLMLTTTNLENGKKMYGIYCAICHGKKGDSSESTLMKREKFVGVPNYNDRDITEGSIYHVIMYGKNVMGSHASQLKYKERWQVVQYVEKLRQDLLK
ncbi:MAG: cytochrome c [Flavobacteriaceae bacterium]|nr:cytochrome c [Flavobacteriaceae bacterium]